MRIIGNLLWWLFGGLEAAIGYFTGSLAIACTIIGIPVALQTFKIGLLCLWPFGAEVKDTESPMGCIRIPLIPFAKQHFKMAKLSLAPFGKDVSLNL